MFSVNCVYILTWGEMNALCWLAKNDIIIRDGTDNLQQTDMYRYYQIPCTAWKGEQEVETNLNPWRSFHKKSLLQGLEKYSMNWSLAILILIFCFRYFCNWVEDYTFMFWISSVISLGSFFLCNDFRWEVVVCFVDIGIIVDHHFQIFFSLIISFVSQEAYIAELDAKSGASLKLTILNKKGRIWTMVAGGGASVIYA